MAVLGENEIVGAKTLVYAIGRVKAISEEQNRPFATNPIGPMGTTFLS